MKRKRFILLALGLAMMLSACADAIPEPLVSENTPAPIEDLPPVMPEYPVSFDGETFETSPASVASLSPAITKILNDLGLGDRICAVSDYCDAPEDMKRIGSAALPDVEAIKEAAPELLITQSPIAATDRLKLKEAGVRVLEMAAPKSYAELCDEYMKLGLAFYGAVSGRERPNEIISEMNEVFMALSSAAPDRTWIVIEDYAPEGMMLTPQGSFAAELFGLLGKPAWTEEKYTATEEELYELAPDVVYYSDKVDRDDVEREFPHSELVEIDFARVEQACADSVRAVGEVAGS